MSQFEQDRPKWAFSKGLGKIFKSIIRWALFKLDWRSFYAFSEGQNAIVIYFG
jgi:hypothetical protein